MDDLVQACIICNGILGGDAVKAKLGTKGCDGINKASTARGDSLAANPGEFVHIECRKKYCNSNKTQMGPRWAAHMGPIWVPIWDPYGTHILCWLGWSDDHRESLVI